MKTFKKIALTMVLATPLMMATAHANHGHDYHGKHMNKIYKELNLTDEQQAEIKTIRQAQREQMTQWGKQGPSAERHAEMQALMSSPDFNEKAARELLDKRHEATVDRKLAHMKSQHQVFQVLTPEQQVKFQEIMATHLENYKGNNKGKSE